jgi:hypothetical protein
MYYRGLKLFCLLNLILPSKPIPSQGGCLLKVGVVVSLTRPINGILHSDVCSGLGCVHSKARYTVRLGLLSESVGCRRPAAGKEILLACLEPSAAFVQAWTNCCQKGAVIIDSQRSGSMIGAFSKLQCTISLDYARRHAPLRELKHHYPNKRAAIL